MGTYFTLITQLHRKHWVKSFFHQLRSYSWRIVTYLLLFWWFSEHFSSCIMISLLAFLETTSYLNVCKLIEHVKECIRHSCIYSWLCDRHYLASLSTIPNMLWSSLFSLVMLSYPLYSFVLILCTWLSKSITLYFVDTRQPT